MLRSRVSGAVGSSFFPENTQIEFALCGPAVGLPFPVISPANATLVLTLMNAATQVATTSKRVFLTPTSPSDGRLWRRAGGYRPEIALVKRRPLCRDTTGTNLSRPLRPARYGVTTKRELSLRPKTSGKYVSAACAGATKKLPGAVA